MQNISIIGGSLTGNRGAEAMLISVIGSIRKRLPDTRFVVYTCHPVQDRRVLEDTSVVLHSSTPLSVLLVLPPFSALLGLLKCFRLGFAKRVFPACVRDLEASDALIDIAGVSFIDGRGKYLPYNILTVFPALVLRVPVYKFSQGMGPFQNRFNRMSARFVLGACRRVYARGDQTLAHVRSLGIADNVIGEAADVAFLRRPEDSLSNENPEHLQTLLVALDDFRSSGRPIVGVCPSAVIAAKALTQGLDYVAFLTDVVQYCVDHDMRVLLFSNSTREHYPNQRKNNDLPFILETVRRLDDRNTGALSRIAYMSHDLNADAVGRMIAACDATVVSRFHAMVASLASGVPTLVLGWSHKYLEVMRQFGQQDWVLDVASMEAGCITPRLLEILARREELAAEIRSHLAAIKASADAQIHDVAGSLTQSGRDV